VVAGSNPVFPTIVKFTPTFWSLINEIVGFKEFNNFFINSIYIIKKSFILLNMCYNIRYIREVFIWKIKNM